MLLEISNLRAAYGPIEALRGISLSVAEGEIVSLIGANGAGKTSVLLAISSILRALDGQIQFFGRPIQNSAPHELVRKGIAHVPEGRKIFSRLTVMENLRLGAFMRPQDKSLARDLEEMFVLFPVLRDRRTQLGGTLSGGEQQMLAIARALMSRPVLLLMDEPSMGIAPLLVAKIFATIQELNKKGLTILLVEQNAHLALKVAHRGYVIETGKIVIHDTAEALRKDPRVKEAYLGEGGD